MQWIWVGLNLACIDAYAVLEWENDMKLHVFATKHKANKYHEHSKCTCNHLACNIVKYIELTLPM